MDAVEPVGPITIKKSKPPEQGALQPDSRGLCAVGGAGPDRRIDEILQNLKAIRAPLPGGMPDSVIKELAKTVKHILSIVEGRAAIEVVEEPLMTSYPRSGKKTLQAGTTAINIKGRQVRLADGTTDDLYSPRSLETCRSILLYTSRLIDVRVLSGGDVVFNSSFFAGQQRLLHVAEFDSIEIDATDETIFYIVVAQDPEGVPSIVQAVELADDAPFSRTPKITPYKVYTYEWTTSPPTDHEIDLGGWANTITFIDAPVNCSIKLVSEDNDAIPDIEADQKIEGILFNKVFVTSTTTDTSIKFFVAWGETN